MSLGTSGTDLGGPGTPIWDDLASILSKRFRSNPFHAHDSIPFRSIPFHSIQLLRAVPSHSMPFHCIAISLHAVPGFRASGIPELDAAEIPTCRFPDLEPPIGLGGMREA